VRHRTARLADLVRPGARIAVGDGLGSPRCISAELSAVAADTGGVRLLLGWTPVLEPTLDLTSFADVRTVMSGWGLRSAVDAGLVRALPVRLSAVPALLHGPLRPNVLVATVVPRARGGFTFGTEVGWMRAALDAGAVLAGVVSSRTPVCDAGPPLPADQVMVVGETDDPPATLAFTAPGPEHRAIAGHVAGLMPQGARLQVGPGPLGRAVLDALDVPVRIDSGLLPDGVEALDRRGLLTGTPIGTYVAGGPGLLEWADGRSLLHPVEYSHDLGRLSSGLPFVAVNTALEVDAQAQVNVEGLRGSAVGGIGGHADYATAATRSPGGLSIVAVPSRHRGHSTLVARLSSPVSTPGHDIDVLVTESGAVDLRGLDRSERARAITGLWASAPEAADTRD
jgi:acyl-CoA hydrolase